MDKNDFLKLFNITDINDLPNSISSILQGDIDERNCIYRKLLELNNYNLSYDWFQPIYESELSERKKKKQDFTPYELGVLCSKLTCQKGTIHEPTAGNGGMIIADWWQRCKKVLPWEFFPSENMVTCWELSVRSIPILLLNLSIRGIMGYVYHGDVLEGNIIKKYILLNKNNDPMAFSDIVEVNVNDKIVGYEDR